VQAMSRQDFESHMNAVGLESGWFSIAAGQGDVALANLSFHGPLQKLYEYLLESGWIEELPPIN
jgi:hypothetical protein